MTLLLGFLLGFFVAAVLAHFKPELFSKLMMLLAGVTAAIAGAWETIMGMF